MVQSSLLASLLDSQAARRMDASAVSNQEVMDAPQTCSSRSQRTSLSAQLPNLLPRLRSAARRIGIDRLPVERLAHAANAAVAEVRGTIVNVRDQIDASVANIMRSGRSAAFASAEMLEDRRLLSGVSMVNSVLTVTGNSTIGNRLVVVWSNDHQRLNIVENRVVRTLKYSGKEKIRIVGGSGNDFIYVAPELQIPVNISSGAGKNLIFAPLGAAIPGGTNLTSTLAAAVPGVPGSGGTGVGGSTATGSGSSSSSEVGASVVTTGTGASTGTVVIPAASSGTDLVGSVGWTPVGSASVGNVSGSRDGVSTFYGHNPDPSAPQPVVDVLEQTVYANSAVHFNATQSSLGAGDPLSSFYQWNFGDPSGEHNTLTGWNAAHVYHNPGQYSATLTLSNELGKTSSLSVTINVLAENRRTIYVDSNSGNDSSNGGSPGNPIRSINRAAQLIGGGNVRILFHTDEQFNVTRAIGISVTASNVYMGSYGGGSAPTIMIDGPDAAIQSFRGSHNLVIYGLTFDSVYKPIGNFANHISATAIFPGGSNTLVENCTFLNVDSAVNAEQAPTGVMMLDNTSPLATGLRGYLFWGQGRDDVIIGNYCANSTREHCLRTEGVDRILAAYNNFTNLNRSRIDKQDFSKGSLEIHKGTYAYVLGNTLADGPLRAGPRGDNTEPASTNTSWTVFDGNKITTREIQLYPGTHHMVIRNNIIQFDGQMAINIQPSDREGRNISDIRIFNNTAIDNSTIGQFLYTVPRLAAGSILMGNNLFVAPHLIPGGYGTAPVYVSEPNLNAFLTIFDNVWPDPSQIYNFSRGGINYVWPVYSNAGAYYTPGRWNALPQVNNDKFISVSLTGGDTPTGPAASDGARIAGLFTDFYGKLRPSSSWSVGAVQA